MIPYYLKNHLIDIKETRDKTTAILSSAAGNTNLEIFFYGELINIKRTPFITDGEFPCIIVAKDPVSGEEFVVFDGMKHGYDPLFCNEYLKNAKRNLIKYEKYNGRIQIRLGYSVDYEEDKDDYEFVGDQVKTMYGVLGWEDMKSIGYDWISLSFIDVKKEFFEAELA